MCHLPFGYYPRPPSLRPSNLTPVYLTPLFHFSPSTPIKPNGAHPFSPFVQNRESSSNTLSCTLFPNSTSFAAPLRMTSFQNLSISVIPTNFSNTSYLLGYLEWFRSSSAPWPSWGLHHLGKFLERALM